MKIINFPIRHRVFHKFLIFLYIFSVLLLESFGDISNAAWPQIRHFQCDKLENPFAFIGKILDSSVFLVTVLVAIGSLAVWAVWRG